MIDLDEASGALWLEAVDHDGARWDEDRFTAAAHARGRFAGRAAVRTAASAASPHTVRGYGQGRVTH